MSHLEHDIKDEEKGEARYKALARKNPKYAKAFKGMAKDEERHHEKLEKMEKSEAKTKAMRKRTK